MIICFPRAPGKRHPSAKFADCSYTMLPMALVHDQKNGTFSADKFLPIPKTSLHLSACIEECSADSFFWQFLFGSESRSHLSLSGRDGQDHHHTLERCQWPSATLKYEHYALSV